MGSAHGGNVVCLRAIYNHRPSFYLLSTYDIIQIPGLPVVQRAALKNWVWPGDEANAVTYHKHLAR